LRVANQTVDRIGHYRDRVIAEMTDYRRSLRGTTSPYAERVPNSSSDGEGAAVDDAVALVEIEAIKRLKARYCRHLDAKDWSAWRGVFADDFVSDTAEAGGVVIAGADEFVAFIRKTLGKPSQPTVHQVHAPEIELTSPSTATGVRTEHSKSSTSAASMAPTSTVNWSTRRCWPTVTRSRWASSA
jgi:hypothetical protein